MLLLQGPLVFLSDILHFNYRGYEEIEVETKVNLKVLVSKFG